MDKPRIFVGSTGVRGVYLGVPLAPGLRIGHVDVEPPPPPILRPVGTLRRSRARTATEPKKKSRR